MIYHDCFDGGNFAPYIAFNLHTAVKTHDLHLDEKHALSRMDR